MTKKNKTALYEEYNHKNDKSGTSHPNLFKELEQNVINFEKNVHLLKLFIPKD